MVWPAAPPAGLPYARVSVTEDAPRQATASPPARPWLWWWLVAASVVVLLAAAATLATWWAASRETRTTSYRVVGDLTGIRLDLDAADVEIAGGAAAVEVRRVDRFAFGRPSDERRSVEAGTLTIVSRCPEQVLGTCRAAYRLAVPDNVPVEIDTGSGVVALTGVRASVTVTTGSGPITATRFCGFMLSATSDSGAIDVRADCSADRLELRSRTGDVHVTVPTGRYRIDAQSESGASRVRGLMSADAAPFEIQARSASGDVAVEAES